MAMGSPAHIIEDCMGFLQLYSDGTITRSNEMDFNVSAIEDDSITIKDYLFNKKHNLYLRVYKPKSTSTVSSAHQKLPVLIFLHGGGFCFGSRTWPQIHNTCVRLASALEAVVVAPDYRLAPEHRLPAAIEDAMETMRWLQRQALINGKQEEGDHDTWLGGSGIDFDRVFIVGDSSGGNIAHHLAVQLGSGSRAVDPVCVRGYVLMAPFFGGELRTKSEEGPSELMLNLDLLDRFWRLSLPVGEIQRDHPLANPFGRDSPSFGLVKLDPILVMAGSDELLKDRAADYATRLKQVGKNIKFVEFEGKQHGFFTHDPYAEDSNQVIQLIQTFMLEN